MNGGRYSNNGYKWEFQSRMM